MGYRVEGEAAYRGRGNRLSAWQSSLMTSINELVLPGRLVCRFILLSSGTLLSGWSHIPHLFSPCSAAAQ